MIADFGGHDTDLRQQNVSDPSVPDTHNIVKLLIEALTYPDSPLARIINQNVAQNNSRPAVEYNSIQPQVKEEAEHSNTVHVDSIQFKDHQSPVMLETDATCLPYSVSISEADADNVLRLKVRNLFFFNYDSNCKMGFIFVVFATSDCGFYIFDC